MKLHSAEMFRAAAMLRQHSVSLAQFREESEGCQREITHAGFSGNALEIALGNVQGASTSLNAPAHKMAVASTVWEVFATFQHRAEERRLSTLGDDLLRNHTQLA